MPGEKEKQRYLGYRNVGGECWEWISFCCIMEGRCASIRFVHVDIIMDVLHKALDRLFASFFWCESKSTVGMEYGERI